MARKMTPKAEVEVKLVELVEDHDHGAIGIHPSQSTYPLSGVLRFVVVDLNEIIIDYQDVVLVEETLFPFVMLSGANCLSAV